MARQEEIRVGSIVAKQLPQPTAGIVLAYPSRRPHHFARPAADIYWFKYKRADWAYINYLEVLVR